LNRFEFCTLDGDIFVDKFPSKLCRRVGRC
jgi:hypothetical protein